MLSVKQALLHVADFIIPPTCFTCQTALQRGSIVKEGGNICPKCWGAFTPLGRNKTYADLALEPCAFTHFYAPFLYEQKASALIRALKYADGLRFAKFMAHQMAASLPVGYKADVIVPVPLHPKRLYSRKYNQAAELTRFIAQKLVCPYNMQNLVRTRKTPPQVGQKANVRQKQLKNAFEATSIFKDQHVLLVDDVCTTGSTADACAHALLKAGATQVDLITFAYVLPG